MTIADGKYAAEVISERAEFSRFDDIMALLHYGNDSIQNDGSICE
jgi:copper chaperone NosL